MYIEGSFFLRVRCLLLSVCIEHNDIAVCHISRSLTLVVQTVAIGETVDGRLGVVALTGWSTEDGDDARVAGLSAPVGHGASVGPQFVEAREQDAVHTDVTVGFTVTDRQFAPLHHVARGAEQFHIEHLAQVGAALLVGAGHVGFEPDGFAFEIARVVEVQIDFLLRIGLAEAHSLLDVGQRTDGVGEVFQTGEQGFAFVGWMGLGGRGRDGAVGCGGAFGGRGGGGRHGYLLMSAGNEGVAAFHLGVGAGALDGRKEVVANLLAIGEGQVVVFHIGQHGVALHLVVEGRTGNVVHLGEAVLVAIVDFDGDVESGSLFLHTVGGSSLDGIDGAVETEQMQGLGIDIEGATQNGTVPALLFGGEGDGIDGAVATAREGGLCHLIVVVQVFFTSLFGKGDDEDIFPEFVAPNHGAEGVVDVQVGVAQIGLYASRGRLGPVLAVGHTEVAQIHG